jgi:DNA-binding MarR family transcriptional regulator
MSSSRSVTEKIGYVLKQVQYALRSRMDEDLRRCGLTTAQYAALAALEEEPGASAASLARRCFVTAQTMTGIIVNLETAGLIERSDYPQHGRVLQTAMTAKGARVLAAAHEISASIEQSMLKGLGGAQRQALGDSLRRCLANLQEARETPTRRSAKAGRARAPRGTRA